MSEKEILAQRKRLRKNLKRVRDLRRGRAAIDLCMARLAAFVTDHPLPQERAEAL